MAWRISRRAFVKGSFLTGIGAGLALGKRVGAPAPSPAATSLPKGRLGNLEVSRLLLGGNLLTHYTHSRDLRYVYALVEHYNTPDKILETLALAEEHGINTLVIHTAGKAVDVLLSHYRKQGGRIQRIICPTAPMEDGLVQFREQAKKLVDDGVEALYIWGVRSDALVQAGRVDLIGKAVEMVKGLGVPCGVGAHLLEVVVECERHQVPCDFYLKTLHHLNYPSARLNYDSCWCPNPEEVIALMEKVSKPWIAFKVMAAGAIPPADAFRFAFAHGADFVLAGMFDFEIAEDARLVREILSNLPPRNRPWRA